jgi:pimeloyl-ACP methyl ester carboxylesterase
MTCTTDSVDKLEVLEGVVLLHGLCRRKSSMNRMAKHLEASGYVVVNIGYPSRKMGIEELSEQTLSMILNDPRLASCARVHFVTHSMGGILVRSYFTRHSPGKLGRVVMLGPPNGGSEVVDKLYRWWVFKLINGPAGSELGTRGQSVPNNLGKVEFELGVIAGDRSINWINSCFIKGPDDGKVSVERTKVDGMRDHVVVHATHPLLMKNRKVIELTKRFLRSGSFGGNLSTT